MPLAPVIATHLTTPESRSISVFAGGRDVTSHVKWDTLVVTDSGSSAKGTASAHLTRGLADLPELTDQAQLRMVDHVADREAYRGYVETRQPSSVPGYDSVSVVAGDIGSLLDDIVVGAEVRPLESMSSRIGYLWGAYSGAHLSGDLSFVQELSIFNLEAATVTGTLRQAIERCIAEAHVDPGYYVDMTGRLHVFSRSSGKTGDLGTVVTETNAAPFNIDADAPGAGEIAPEDLAIDFDSGGFANRVWVEGGTPEASLFVQDDAAIAAANGLVRTATLSAPDSTSAAKSRSLGLMYLGRLARSIARGTFSTTSPRDGWRGGQNVSVTSAAHGLAGATFRIARVTTRIAVPGVALKRRYVVEFGGTRAGLGG